jgi:Holliday junction resolvasome RuvABC endonuclease subunit
MKILAIDPATKCGWAHSVGASGVWDLSIRRDESGGMRLLRLRAKLNAVFDDVGVDVLVFEAARNAAPKMQGALSVQSELQGVIKLWCHDNGVEYRGYSPSEIKKHATGKGNANKDAILKAARQRWPDVEIVDDNQADALWLLDLAQKELEVGESR